MEPRGIEPPTSNMPSGALSPSIVGAFDKQSPGLFADPKAGGAEGDRTPDLYNAIVALSQLSYGPNLLIFSRHPMRWSGEPPGVAVPGNILKPAPSFK